MSYTTMNEEEQKLFDQINSGNISSVGIDHNMGMIYFYMNDGNVITIVSGEDEITVEYEKTDP